MVEPTSLLLGLEGLGVRAVVQRADRTRVVEVITVDPNASRCPDCGMASDSVKERTVTSPRDVRYGDDPIILRWNTTRRVAGGNRTPRLPQNPVVSLSAHPALVVLITRLSGTRTSERTGRGTRW